MTNINIAEALIVKIEIYSSCPCVLDGVINLTEDIAEALIVKIE